MDALWNFFIQLGKWFGLVVIGLALLGGLINGIVEMASFSLGFWPGFYGMLVTWVTGIWAGLLLIALCKVAEKE